MFEPRFMYYIQEILFLRHVDMYSFTIQCHIKFGFIVDDLTLAFIYMYLQLHVLKILHHTGLGYEREV